jgi:ribosomal protein S18 acetylase RimI-like enzyme
LNNQKIAEKNFSEFQRALNKKLIECQKGDIHDDIIFHMDKLQGSLRFTYGLIGAESRLKASCVVIPSNPYKEKPCFDIGLATLEKFRRQGHGESILQKSIDELKNGLNRNGITEFYIELKVDSGNEASHNLCRKFSDEVIEKENGRIYLKLIK